jgi:pantoate--beta-alanine ligase
MNIARTVHDVRRHLATRRAETIGLVPTMGALHAGHAALCHTARGACDVVVASVFVNPSQFNDPKDLSAYPRDEAADARAAEQAGVDLLFVPSADEMYPPGFATWVDVGGAAEGFEGDRRPGHFRGVATVCLKLFAIVEPDLVFFGQKDAQQVAVIQQMVRDFQLNLAVRVVPTVRDSDGLALSSRNRLLDADDRRAALAIPRALDAGLAAFRAGGDPVAAARPLLAHLEVEYVEVADFGGQPTLVIAARAGRTRLIDNVRLDRE